MSEYNADEPAAFDAIVERQPYEPAVESADPFGGDREGLSQAADEVSRARENREVKLRQVHDPDNPAEIADRDVTLSKETAASSLTEIRGGEARLLQAEIDAATARAVDDFRGPAQPEQPEFQQTQPQQPELQPQPEYAPAESNPELDQLLSALPPEGRQPFLDNYHRVVQQAQYQTNAQYSEALQRTAAVQQQLQQGVQQAGQIAVAGLLVAFPELNGVSAEQLPAALQMLERSNPTRHQQLANHMSQVRQTIQVAQQQQQQQQIIAQQQQQYQAEVQKQQFQRFAAHHDELVAAVPPEVANEVVAMAQEHGISRQELLDLYNTSPILRHSAFQSALRDAALYRMSKRSIPQAVSRPVPRVQKPGTISDEGRDNSQFASLSRQFAGKPLNPRQAAELLIAKRSRR